MQTDELTREVAREILFRLSPPAWAERTLGIELDPWQVRQVSAPAGARVICLVHRQAGKTTGGSVAVAHTMILRTPGSTSLVLAPTQKQSAEFVRRLREHLLKAGEKLGSTTRSASRSRTARGASPCRGRMMPGSEASPFPAAICGDRRGGAGR